MVGAALGKGVWLEEVSLGLPEVEMAIAGGQGKYASHLSSGTGGKASFQGGIQKMRKQEGEQGAPESRQVGPGDLGAQHSVARARCKGWG